MQISPARHFLYFFAKGLVWKKPDAILEGLGFHGFLWWRRVFRIWRLNKRLAFQRSRTANVTRIFNEKNMTLNKSEVKKESIDIERAKIEKLKKEKVKRMHKD